MRNANPYGIPQGTPISTVLSNVYLLGFDEIIVSECTRLGAFFRRYSDDILIICSPSAESALRAVVERELATHRLKLAGEKTVRTIFYRESVAEFQYRGFDISPQRVVIRGSSLSRQWRKAKRAIARTKEVGLAAVAEGQADKIFVKSLRKRFSAVGARNFPAYSRRAASAFGSKKITRQVLRLERRMDAEIRALQTL